MRNLPYAFQKVRGNQENIYIGENLRKSLILLMDTKEEKDFSK